MKNLLVSLCLVLFFISCGSNTTSQGNTHASSSSNESISFELDGNAWATTGWGQYREADGRTYMNVNGTNTANGMDQFGIKIHDFNGVGEYSPLGESGQNGFVLTFTSLNRSTGTNQQYQVTDHTSKVKVTAFDPTTKIISGEFNFTLKDRDGNIVPLTNGKFTDIELQVVN